MQSAADKSTALSILQTRESFDADAGWDALHLVTTGESACGDSYADLSAPDGEWAWSSGDASTLPPWIDADETCFAHYGWGGHVTPRPHICAVVCTTLYHCNGART